MTKRVAFAIMRVTLGVVFLVFGIGKFRNDIWAQTMRNMSFFGWLPWSADVSVVLVGVMEVATGAGLILGLFTRVFAGVAAIQLAAILTLLSFQETRDIGLFGAAVYMAIAGQDGPGVAQLWKWRRAEEGAEQH